MAGLCRVVHNKRELLLWDAWGLGLREPDARGVALLDCVADPTQAAGERFAELRALYEASHELKVPAVVTSFSPAASPREVTLGV